MRYLILSPIGLAMFLVPHLGQSKDVEKIYFCALSSEMKELGKDMNKMGDWEKLEVVHDYAQVLNENKPSDLIVVIDDVGIGQTGKMIENMGYKVIGGKPITDRIEEDRQFATDLMKRVMDVPESVSFTSWERAIEFVKTNEPDDRLVFKPNDADVPKEYTYVAKDVADMVEAMQKFKSEWKWKEDFQIQRFIKGTEVDFSGYFNGKEFLTNSMMIYFENKPFMNGDIGPATGGSIAVEFARPVQGVFGDILKKLTPMLAKEGYKGQLAINSIVSDEDHKPYFLEFCGRFGYPSLPFDITILEEQGHTVHQLFMALANSEQKTLFGTDKIAATISVFVPPAPTGDKEVVEDTKGEPISWSPKWYRYFYPYYVMYDKKMVLAGISSWVLQITCADVTLDGAVSMLYDTYVPTLKLQNAMFRTDLGKDAKKRIKAIKEAKLV